MNRDALRSALERIDGRGYPAYKDVRGRYDMGGWVLSIEHVQGDPFAAPSRVHAELPAGVSRVPADLAAPGPRGVATADQLARAFASAARSVRGEGSGRGGRMRGRAW